MKVIDKLNCPADYNCLNCKNAISPKDHSKYIVYDKKRKKEVIINCCKYKHTLISIKVFHLIKMDGKLCEDYESN